MVVFREKSRDFRSIPPRGPIESPRSVPGSRATHDYFSVRRGGREASGIIGPAARAMDFRRKWGEPDALPTLRSVPPRPAKR